MSESLPRPLLALAVVVAAGALFLGIKDYVQQKNPKPTTSTSTPTVVDSSTRAVQKKTTSPKAKRARMSGTEADAPTKTQATADDTEKPLIRKESPNSGSKEVLANNNESNAEAAAHEDQQTAIGQNNNGVHKDQPNKASDIFKPDLSTPKCVPLPNVTSPADVDAPYYQNWAREYSCYDLLQAAAAASN